MGHQCSKWSQGLAWTASNTIHIERSSCKTKQKGTYYDGSRKRDTDADTDKKAG
jgi:hypothetical protein